MNNAMIRYMRYLQTVAAVLLAVPAVAVQAGETQDTRRQDSFNEVPVAWRWTSGNRVMFTYDGTYTDSLAFIYDVKSRTKSSCAQVSAKDCGSPVYPEDAVNMTYSPDSARVAYTRSNDLYVMDVESGREVRLTYDGSDVILNGYASWVYYEEILGRQSRYRAFWWSPDGDRIGFYRFDNTHVPVFPIYSPSGQDGVLKNTRYPKAGERNPEVRIGIINVSDVFSCAGEHAPGGNLSDTGDGAGHAGVQTVWADFVPSEDQYFGIPFWGADSKGFFVTRMPRLQNTLDMFRIDVADGSITQIYHEEYPTWIDWIDGIVFKDDGLYMARRFETGWEQIYFLSYDGKVLRRLTDGPNWNISILRVDDRSGDIYFTANRDASVRQTLYRADSKGTVIALTDPAYDVAGVEFSPDGKYFAASYSNSVTPVKVAVFETSRRTRLSAPARTSNSALRGKSHEGRFCAGHVVADMAYEGFSPDDFALPEIVYLEMEDGLEVPAAITYPKDFSVSCRYPVHVDIYGGPDTPMVRDRWRTPSESSLWWSDNGIIEVVADCRASGHNGRAGLDKIYRQLTVCEVKDFVRWAEWLQSLPYVLPDKIGVEGFSFGGTMTAMLLMQAPEYFHYGVAGGGVYDWSLYDSHYTERYMDTPQNNPDGYRAACVLNYAERYPVEYRPGDEDGSHACPGSAAALPHCPGPVMLKLTHGTGDDNVHFQNTLQLVDTLQKAGKKFELMIYPDGMHGYRGAQKEHFDAANREFWLKYLKGE